MTATDELQAANSSGLSDRPINNTHQHDVDALHVGESSRETSQWVFLDPLLRSSYSRLLIPEQEVSLR